MRKLTWIVQTSLDGFVAGPKREFSNFIGGEENLEFVCSITDEADAAMFGRISYELLQAYWPTAAETPDATKNTIKYSGWYNAVSKIVLSHHSPDNPSGNIRVISSSILTQIREVKRQQGKDILLFGSPTVAHQLLEDDLIDHIWLVVHPVCFGDGISLFRKRDKTIKFSLLHSHQLSNGTLFNKYALQVAR